MFAFTKPRIFFVYAERYKYSGSTVMRGKQLMSIVKRYYKNEFRFRYVPISTNYRNSLVFLTKGAVTDITTEQITELRRRGNRVVIDPVDNPLDTSKAKLANGVVAASLEAFDDFKKQGFTSYLVNHAVDTRLPKQATSPLKSLRIGYFGELVNTVITDKISAKVDFVHVDTGRQANEWLTKPREYNLHYAVRADNVEGFKPFLKGFTAAATGANIVIQRDQKEALRWLGKDYPYLLPARPSEKTILAMLDHIEKSYGTSEWKKALERMAEIREQTSDKSIADEFIMMTKLALED